MSEQYGSSFRPADDEDHSEDLGGSDGICSTEQDNDDEAAVDARSATDESPADEFPFGFGTDLALADMNRLAALNYTQAADDRGPSVCLTKQVVPPSEGAYGWHGDIDPDEIDDDELIRIGDEMRDVLPLAAEAVKHAALAVALDPDNEEGQYWLPRAMEEVADILGTLRVVNRELAFREDDEEREI